MDYTGSKRRQVKRVAKKKSQGQKVREANAANDPKRLQRVRADEVLRGGKRNKSVYA